MKKAIALAAALVLTPAYAAPPDDSILEHGPFYRALKSPATGGGCCSEADCRPVQARTTDFVHWEVFFDKRSFGPTAPDQWMPIPDEIVIRNPPKLSRPQEAVACWYLNRPYCFTEPAWGG